MRTWSIESVLRNLERITRPEPRRTGFDEEVARESLSELQPEICRAHQREICASCDEDNDELWVHPRDFAAEQLAERQAEEECSEPISRPPFIPGVDVHLEDGQPYRFGRDIKVGEQYCAICGDLLSAGFHSCPVLAAQRATDVNRHSEPRYCGSLQPAGLTSYRCTKRLGHDGAHGYNGVVWEADEPPPLNNPSTLDDVVAQLCQLTYLIEDMRNLLTQRPERADTQDAQMWRAFVGAKTLCDDCRPSPRDPAPDDDLAVRLAQILKGADSQTSASVTGAEPHSPAASAAGDSGEVARDIPPSPTSPHSDVAGWERKLIDPAYAEIMSALEAHRANHFEPLDAWDCLCGERFHFEQDWRYHLGEKIADALVGQK